MEIANIFIAKLIGMLFLLSGFMNYRRYRLQNIEADIERRTSVLAIIGKILVGLGLILLPNLIGV